MGIFSRFRRTTPLAAISAPQRPTRVVGLNPSKWRDQALTSLEGANERLGTINDEIEKVAQEFNESVQRLTEDRDAEIARLMAHRAGTIQVIKAAKAALDTFPPNTTPPPAPVLVAVPENDPLTEETADALEAALNEVDKGRESAFVDALPITDAASQVKPVKVRDLVSELPKRKRKEPSIRKTQGF